MKRLHKQHLNVSINQLIFFSGKLQETNGPALEDTFLPFGKNPQRYHERNEDKIQRFRIITQGLANQNRVCKICFDFFFFIWKLNKPTAQRIYASVVLCEDNKIRAKYSNENQT